MIRQSALAALLLFIIVFVGLATRAQTVTTEAIQDLNNKSALTGQWKLGINYKTYQENKDEANKAGGFIKVKPIYSLTDSISFDANLEFKFQSANVQERFDTGSENSNIDVNHFTLSFVPSDKFQFNAGVLNQEDELSELLIDDDNSFPGFKQMISTGSGDYRLSFLAKQMMPTSHSLNDQRVEKEEVPYLFTESLVFAADLNNKFTGSLFVTHYNYTDLPAVVAEKSYLKGNTVNQTPSEFVYNFSGLTWGANSKLPINSNIHIGGKLHFIQNNEAPKAYNRGQYIELNSEIKLGEIEINPRFISFFNESDSAPAAYSPGQLGFNNRVGDGVGLGVKFNDFGFQVVSQYIQTEPINDNAVQFKREDFVIKLETLYATF